MKADELASWDILKSAERHAQKSKTLCMQSGIRIMRLRRGVDAGLIGADDCSRHSLDTIVSWQDLIGNSPQFQAALHRLFIAWDMSSWVARGFSSFYANHASGLCQGMQLLLPSVGAVIYMRKRKKVSKPEDRPCVRNCSAKPCKCSASCLPPNDGISCHNKHSGWDF